MAQERLTDRKPLIPVEASENLVFYVVDKADVSEHPDGSSYQVSREDLITVLGIGSGGVDLSGYQKRDEKGAANGYASLDSGGKVPADQLPDASNPLWLGTYTSLANLQAAHPTAEAGSSANIDEGVGHDVRRALWDNDDSKWVVGGVVTDLQTQIFNAITKADIADGDFSIWLDSTDGMNLVKRSWAHIKAELNNGSSSSYIKSISEKTENFTLSIAEKDELVRVSGYTTVIIPSGLGLRYRTIIKKTEDSQVSLLPFENVVIETPDDKIAEILGKFNAIELVCEKIDSGIEYWGVYGSLENKSDFVLLDGLKQIININDDLSITTMTYPSVYKSSDFPLFTTTKKYFTIYSTDHATLNGGQIWWGEMDDPEFNGFVQRARINTPGDGYQVESPFLIKIPTVKSGLSSDTYFLYYHTDTPDPSNNSAQETHLITTSGGSAPHLCTWVERKDTNGDNTLHLEPGENHTGYLRVWEKSDGSYIGYHVGYGNMDQVSSVNRTSTSIDGINWVRSGSIASRDYFTDDGGSGKSYARFDLQFLYENAGTVYGICKTGVEVSPGSFANVAGTDAYSLCTLNPITYKPEVYIRDILLNVNNEFFQSVIYLENDVLYIYVRSYTAFLDKTGDWYIFKFPFNQLGL